MRKLSILWGLVFMACSAGVPQVETPVDTVAPTAPLTTIPSSTFTPTHFHNYKGTPVDNKATLSALLEGTKDSKWYTTDELHLAGKYWIVVDYHQGRYFAMGEDEARELLGTVMHIADGMLRFGEQICEFEKLEVQVVSPTEYLQRYKYLPGQNVLEEIGLNNEEWAIIENVTFSQCLGMPWWVLHIPQDENLVLSFENTFFVLAQWQPGQATPTPIPRPTLTPTPLATCVPDPDFEYGNSLRDFYPTLRSAILNGDKEFIANLIYYPVNPSIAGEKVEINTREEFLSNYDVIITERILTGAENTLAEDLFVNWQGAMIGQGALWFNVFVFPGECNYEFRITAINN